MVGPSGSRDAGWAAEAEPTSRRGRLGSVRGRGVVVVTAELVLGGPSSRQPWPVDVCTTNCEGSPARSGTGVVHATNVTDKVSTDRAGRSSLLAAWWNFFMHVPVSLSFIEIQCAVWPNGILTIMKQCDLVFPWAQCRKYILQRCFHVCASGWVGLRRPFELQPGAIQ